MTTGVPKLSKTDTVPFKALQSALQSARRGESASASFASALQEADASKAAVRRGSEVADSSGQLRSQTGESGTLAESVVELTRADNETVSTAGSRSTKSGDLESAAKNSDNSTEALAVASANVAGVAAPLLSALATPTAPVANVSTGSARVSKVAPGLASAAGEKASELATSSAPASAAVLSTSQGSTISGVMDPALFAAPGGGVGAATSFDSSIGGAAVAAGASGASGSVSSGLAGGPIGFGGAAGAVQGAGQGTATNALLNAGRSEANVSGVGTTGSRAASFSNTSGAVSIASALAAASVVRSAQSSALSDSAGLSTTAGSITGTLSVPVMSGSAGADLGGNALGTQTGWASSESGSSSGGSRSGGSNAFTVQASNPSEPTVIASLSGAANATTTAARATNAASVVDVAANQSPALDVNAPAAQASVAADPRVAWRDLRSKWDQPIRANAPKG